MKDLIEALTILLKYGNPDYPTVCEHDVMVICDIDPNVVSVEDLVKLKDLGFITGDQYGEITFYSYKFGSA